jgi:hypothetical protein
MRFGAEEAMEALELIKAFAGPVATIIAAGTAAVITFVFNSWQLEIAKQQAATADAQRKIAAARLNFDLFAKRFLVFKAARELWVDVVQNADVNSRFF